MLVDESVVYNQQQQSPRCVMAAVLVVVGSVFLNNTAALFYLFKLDVAFARALMCSVCVCSNLTVSLYDDVIVASG